MYSRGPSTFNYSWWGDTRLGKRWAADGGPASLVTLRRSDVRDARSHPLLDPPAEKTTTPQVYPCAHACVYAHVACARLSSSSVRAHPGHCRCAPSQSLSDEMPPSSFSRVPPLGQCQAQSRPAKASDMWLILAGLHCSYQAVARSVPRCLRAAHGSSSLNEATPSSSAAPCLRRWPILDQYG